MGNSGEDALCTGASLILALACGSDHLPKSVHQIEQQRDDLWCDGQRAVSKMIQQVLRGMGKSQKTFDLQQAGVALHGMDDTKDALNRLAVSGTKLEFQNGLLHQAEPF